MTTQSIFILALLPGLILCASINWNSKHIIPNTVGYREFQSQPTSNGITHLFWMKNAVYNYYLMYQILLPNGTLLDYKKISAENIHGGLTADMSTQISNDDMHLLVAYTARRGKREGHCDDKNTDYCHEVFFTESHNGGKDWIKPIRMPRNNMNDTTERLYPSVLLEKDTGRVYISYTHKNNSKCSLTLSVREPGRQTFELEQTFPRDITAYSPLLGYTIDRANSKTYLHLFFENPGETDLYYTQSIDNGKTWTADVKLLSGVNLKTPSASAINTQINEAGLFIQYFERNDVRVIWSKNHGKTWESPRVVGNNVNEYNDLCMCGFTGKSLLFSASVRATSGSGFIRYTDSNEMNFKSIAYPFDSMKGETGYPDINCRYMGNNKYSVILMAPNKKDYNLYIARGIFEDTT